MTQRKGSLSLIPSLLHCAFGEVEEQPEEAPDMEKLL